MLQQLLQRLLLLPLLTPLLAVLLVGALNPRPWVSLRMLTWSSPSWPLGGWIATAAAMGAGLSAAGTALALQGSSPSLGPRRQVRRRPEPQAEQGYQEREQPSRAKPAWPNPQASWAGPSRSAGEPAPTVSVPFRVIRRSKQAAQAPAQAGAQSSVQSSAQPARTSAGGPASGADDWNSPSSDDW